MIHFAFQCLSIKKILHLSLLVRVQVRILTKLKKKVRKFFQSLFRFKTFPRIFPAKTFYYINILLRKFLPESGNAGKFTNKCFIKLSLQKITGILFSVLSFQEFIISAGKMLPCTLHSVLCYFLNKFKMAYTIKFRMAILLHF